LPLLHPSVTIYQAHRKPHKGLLPSKDPGHEGALPFSNLNDILNN
jgi:hypothetical protein